MKSRTLPVIVMLLITSSTQLWADSDGASWFSGRFGADSESLPAVDHALYKEECGSCHFAYQPQFLPAASWRKIMGDLANHFGDNAELGTKENRDILAYLEQNAADRSNTYLARKILKRMDENAPLRITKTRFFQHEHDELPRAILRGKSSVKSLSNCSECHTKANTGSYSEKEIKIPGIGRWED